MRPADKAMPTSRRGLWLVLRALKALFASGAASIATWILIIGALHVGDMPAQSTLLGDYFWLKTLPIVAAWYPVMWLKLK
jgi:hypothetical protein